MIGLNCGEANAQNTATRRYSNVCVTVTNVDLSGYYVYGYWDVKVVIDIDPSEVGEVQCANMKAVKWCKTNDCSSSIPAEEAVASNQCHQGVGNSGTGNVPPLHMEADCYKTSGHIYDCYEACAMVDFLSDGQSPDSIQCFASHPNKRPVLGSARWGVQETNWTIYKHKPDYSPVALVSGEVVSDYAGTFEYDSCLPTDDEDFIISETYTNH
jgi:hypothetical protein